MSAATANIEQAMAETQVQAAIAPTARAASNETLFQRIVPPAIVFFSLVATVAWVGFLGYGLVRLVMLPF